MRENFAPVPKPALRPTLETVRKRLQTWRKKGPTGRRLPTALWGAAVELCRDYSVSKVSRALRLDYYGLRKRAHKIMEARAETDLGFVKLDLGAPLVSAAEWRAEMEAPNGAKMTLSLKGAPGDLDPLELSRVFWSQGR
jgi:hypothetical protein